MTNDDIDIDPSADDESIPDSVSSTSTIPDDIPTDRALDWVLAITAYCEQEGHDAIGKQLGEIYQLLGQRDIDDKDMTESPTTDAPDDDPYIDALQAKSWVAADDTLTSITLDTHPDGTPYMYEYHWTTETYIAGGQIQLAIDDDDVTIRDIDTDDNSPVVQLEWTGDDTNDNTDDNYRHTCPDCDTSFDVQWDRTDLAPLQHCPFCGYNLQKHD